MAEGSVTSLGCLIAAIQQAASSGQSQSRQVLTSGCPFANQSQAASIQESIVTGQ